MRAVNGNYIQQMQNRLENQTKNVPCRRINDAELISTMATNEEVLIRAQGFELVAVGNAAKRERDTQRQR